MHVSKAELPAGTGGAAAVALDVDDPESARCVVCLPGRREQRHSAGVSQSHVFATSSQPFMASARASSSSTSPSLRRESARI